MYGIGQEQIRSRIPKRDRAPVHAAGDCPHLGSGKKRLSKAFGGLSRSAAEGRSPYGRGHFPAIAVYRALLESCPERAMEIMEHGMAQRAARVGKTYARLVSLPGMKGVFLKLFSKGAKSGFGEKSGFGQEFLTDSSRELAFNIIKCPYWDLCTVLGCP